MDKYRAIKDKLQDDKVKGLILDFDHTIIHMDVDWQALKTELVETFSLVTKPQDGLLAILKEVKERGGEALQRTYRIIESFEMANPEGAKVIGETVEIAKSVKRRGLKLGIFSGNNIASIKYLLETTGVGANLFDPIFGRDNVKTWKPSPEGIIETLEMWGLKKNEIVYVGDSDLDKEAGEQAGVETFVI